MMRQTHAAIKPVKRLAANCILVISFGMMMELLIRNSPLAFLSSVLNPILIVLNQSPITRWLTAFFLPVVILADSEILIASRAWASIFLITGTLVFFACTGQVYLAKMLKKRFTDGGLYGIIRHPQYVALECAAIGLVIMWPRFLTLVLLSVIVFLFYSLAKDEERGMVSRLGHVYSDYMIHTGMFLPRFAGDVVSKNIRSVRRLSLVMLLAVCLVAVAFCAGAGLILRAIAIRHLPLRQVSNIDIVATTQEELATAIDLLPFVLGSSLVASKLQTIPNDSAHRICAYFIPIDFAMQSMLAVTGEEWNSFEQGGTIKVMVGYILSPIDYVLGSVPYHVGNKRRLIFVGIDGDGQNLASSADDFGINMRRTPLFLVDVRLYKPRLLKVHGLPTEGGWGLVPAPTF